MARRYRNHHFILPDRSGHDSIAGIFSHRKSGIIDAIVQTSDLLGQRNFEQSNIHLRIFLTTLRQQCR